MNEKDTINEKDVINEIVESLFNEELLVNGKTIPIQFADYKGKSEEYIVWFDNGKRPIHSSDDQNTYVEYDLDFNIYSKGNYIDIVRTLKKELIENRFIWIGDDGDKYETDTKYHHYVSNFIYINKEEY